MGLSMGAILGLVALLRVYYFPGAEIHVPAFLLSLTVSLSVLGVVTFGTLVGCMLPFILRSIGFDPALSSSPLVATCMDTLGVMIYFTIAIFILSRFLAT
jgi:magnesium transporter